MANTTPEEEIIEKRPSNPVASACLVVAALATLAAIAFQIWEIHYVRADMGVGPERTSPVAHELFSKKLRDEFKAAAKKVVDEHDHPEITLKAGGAASGEAPAGAAESTPAAEPAPADAGGTPAEPPAEPAPTEGTETKDSEKPADSGASDSEPPPADAPAATDTDQKDPNATEKEADKGAAEPPREEPAKEEPASGEGQN